MKIDYDTCLLDDIGKVCMCKRILKNQTSSTGEVPFYKISTFGDKADSYISKELFEEYKNKYSYPKKGDILISAAGTIGRTVIYDGKDSYYQDSNIVWVDNDESKVINRYLYYFYQLKPWAKTNSSTIERLYNDNIRNIKIKYPVLKKNQESIIEPLVEIDRLIDNGNKMILRINALLDDIYDYYYESKILKKELEGYTFDSKVKRYIPEKWSVMTIGECIKHINTGLNPRSNFKLNTGGKIKYITVKNLNLNGSIDFNNCDLIDDNAFKKVHSRSCVEDNDILFSSISPIGRCYYVLDKDNTWDINESVFSIRTNKEIMSSELLYMYFTSNYFIKSAENNSTGSIFNGIRINTITDMNIVVPDKDTREKITKLVHPILEYRNSIMTNINKYNQLKDKILPLLINGKVSLTN
jgi:type I restriction enzyme S subunit